MSRLITIDDLLGNAEKITKTDKEVGLHKIKLKKLDKEIEVKKVPYREWMDILGTKDADLDAELIYSACDMLHDDTLIEKLGCKDNPINVVRKVFDKQTSHHLADYILEFSGLKIGNGEDYIEKVVSDIKN